MSHIVDTKQVNQFLPSEKLSIPTAEAQALHNDFNGKELEETIWGIVVSKLHEFNLTTWTNNNGVPIPNAIPNTIKNIMGMWVAGRVYMKQFSEESTEKNNYGRSLVDDALEMLNAIAEHVLVVDGLSVIDLGVANDPSVHESDPIFTMGDAY